MTAEDAERIVRAEAEARRLIRRGEYLQTLAMVAKREGDDPEGKEARAELRKMEAEK